MEECPRSLLYRREGARRSCPAARARVHREVSIRGYQEGARCGWSRRWALLLGERKTEETQVGSCILSHCDSRETKRDPSRTRPQSGLEHRHCAPEAPQLATAEILLGSLGFPRGLHLDDPELPPPAHDEVQLDAADAHVVPHEAESPLLELGADESLSPGSQRSVRKPLPRTHPWAAPG